MMLNAHTQPTHSDAIFVVKYPPPTFFKPNNLPKKQSKGNAFLSSNLRRRKHAQ